MLLAAGLLFLSLRGIEWGRVAETIAGARWPGLAALAAIISAAAVIRALRWRILLNAEARLGFREVFRANMAGYLGNNVLPARAGEFIRTFLISRRSGLTKTYVLTTALGERIMDALALVLGSSIVLLQFEPKPAWIGGIAGTVAVAAGAGALCVMLAPLLERRLHLVLRALPLPDRMAAGLSRFAGQVLLGLRAFHAPRRLVSFAALTVVTWAADTAGCVFSARALGIPLSAGGAFLLLTALGLSSAVPSPPGYVGVYQFVATSVLVPLGVARSDALALILVYQAIGYAVVIAYGLPGLCEFRTRDAAAPAGGMDVAMINEADKASVEVEI